MAAVLYPLGHKLESAPAQVLQKALALDVALTVAGGKLHAAGDRASVAELAPLLRQHRDDLVHLLTQAANDPAPDLSKPESDPWRVTLALGTSPKTAARFRAASMALDAAAGARPPTPAPQGFDPGAAALMALAMAYCTHTGASDKARQDWREDVTNTPPELRGDLYQHLREQLRDQRPPAPAPAPARPAPVPKPDGWLHMSQPWRAADTAYQQHHGQCPVCRATATGHSERCVTGQHLHLDYTQAAQAAMKAPT